MTPYPGRKRAQETRCLLDRLVDYTHYHFAHEEELFARTGYPDTAAHRHEHDEMAECMKNTWRRYRNGSIPAPSLEVMNTLKDWLFNHILGSDQRYAPHTKAHRRWGSQIPWDPERTATVY